MPFNVNGNSSPDRIISTFERFGGIAPDGRANQRESKASRVAKWTANGIGLILGLIGMFWILQGSNIISIGVMAGQTQWAIIGLVVGGAGIGLVLCVNRRVGTAP